MSVNSTLTEQVFQKLYNQILINKIYNPGDKIPGENELTQEFGVSRTTIREAIRQLVAQGILEVKRGFGTYVTLDAKAMSDPELRKLESIKIQAKDLYELRLIFEPAIAKLACSRATIGERNTIVQLGKEVIDIAENVGDWEQADLLFHQAIVQATHNNFFSQLIPLINRAFDNGITVGDNIKLRNIPIRDNPDICKAFLDNDPDLAEMAMSIHIKHVMEIVK